MFSESQTFYAYVNISPSSAFIQGGAISFIIDRIETSLKCHNEAFLYGIEMKTSALSHSDGKDTLCQIQYVFGPPCTV